MVHSVQKPQDSGVISSRGLGVLQQVKRSVTVGSSGPFLDRSETLRPVWEPVQQTREVGREQAEYRDMASRGQHHQAVRGPEETSQAWVF